MKYLLDSAEIEEIKKARKTSLLAGVTTNPTLLLRAGYYIEDLPAVYREICDLVTGPVSLEVPANSETNADKMMQAGIQLSHIGSERNAVVKIPATLEGFKAMRGLSRLGIPVNATLIFRREQAIEAAHQGALYLSPFVGRFDDAGIPDQGIRLIEEIKASLYANGLDGGTSIIAASIRNIIQVGQCHDAGADYVTLPMKVFNQMFCVRRSRRNHSLHRAQRDLVSPFTEEGLQRFSEDFDAIPKRRENAKTGLHIADDC